MNLTLISNQTLLVELGELRRKERNTQCLFLRHLAEVDRRRLYADEGYSSLFKYVTSVLGYSPSSALKRIQVARASIRNPEILVRLEASKLSLTVLSKLCSHPNEGNAAPLLDRCEGLSVREVEKLISPSDSEDSPEEIHRLSQNKSRIQFTVSEDFLLKLERAKELLRSKYPKAKLEDVFGDALDLLVDSKTPDAIAKRISPHAASHSRYIPDAVKAEVWERDGGKCTFVSDSGHACAERTFLEYDHIFPWALGGKSHEPGNVRLLCEPTTDLSQNLPMERNLSKKR